VGYYLKSPLPPIQTSGQNGKFNVQAINIKYCYVHARLSLKSDVLRMYIGYLNIKQTIINK
jgi:hypothetical protein